MSDSQQNITTGELSFCSRVNGVGWQGQQGPNAFERWHFDALSDDGREAVVITFHDNYALSPRYFRQEMNANGHSPVVEKRFPAVSFVYSMDGKTVLRTVNEFGDSEFAKAEDGVSCSIGNSSFRVDSASYGSGFVLRIDLLTSRKRRIKAEFEWLSIESDLSEEETSDTKDACWNMAVPRSDVSGRITLSARQEDVKRLIHFRGTGYHDHFCSNHSLVETVGSRYWGRAHFIDSTAIFHYHDLGDDHQPTAKLFLIREGRIDQSDISQMEEKIRRTGYGLKVPQRLCFLSTDDFQLRIESIKVIQSGMFESRTLSEITLMLSDGKPRKTMGITELLTPKQMRSRFFRWLTDLRIGKNGKGPLY